MDPPVTTSGAESSVVGQNTPPAFSSLPLELHHTIFSLLTKNDLTIAARVSKAWNGICTPLVWKTLSLTKKNQFWLFTEPELMQSVFRNREHIRELDLQFLSLLHLFSKPRYGPWPEFRGYSISCRNLQSLSLNSSSGYAKGNVDAQVLALVRHNPLLRVLDFYLPYRELSMRELSEAWGTNLRQINLKFDICPCTAKHLLKNLPELIQQVCLQIYPEKDEQDHDRTADSFQLPPHHSLESVHIKGFFSGYQEYVLLPFLTSCSESLKEFKCPDTACYTNRNIHGALATLGITFKTLYVGELSESCDSTDEAIAQMILSNPQLTSIDIGYCGKASYLTAAAILNNATNLEHLDLRGTRLYSFDVTPILCQAGNLKSITLMVEYYSNGNDVVQCWIQPEAEWACTALETFRGKIEVLRPSDGEDDIEYEDEDDIPPPVTIEESREDQRQVYRQLAKLTKLQELCLGQHCYHDEMWFNYDPDPLQKHCLEMSLESGLGELASLKELRVLDISNMDHRITDVEREWMHAHWPKFEELREWDHYEDEDSWENVEYYHEQQEKWKFLEEMEKESYDSEGETGSKDDDDSGERPGYVLDDGREGALDSEKVEGDSDREYH
ncbi:hypothetical protein BG000_010059 [Podila horticola]|nr:hypothetical protein BG000_010059 [Podila horticola]